MRYIIYYISNHNFTYIHNFFVFMAVFISIFAFCIYIEDKIMMMDSFISRFSSAISFSRPLITISSLFCSACNYYLKFKFNLIQFKSKFDHSLRPILLRLQSVTIATQHLLLKKVNYFKVPWHHNIKLSFWSFYLVLFCLI